MGAALGILLGLGAGALKGYSERKAQEHLLEKQMELQNEAAAKRARMSTFINMATSGQLPNTPGTQKEIIKAFGGDKDAADMFMGVNQLAQQHMRMFQNQVGSAGGGSAPGAGGLHFNGKTDPQSLLDMRGRLENFTNDPNPMVANAAKAHIQQIDAQLKQANAEQRATQAQQFHADSERDRALMRDIQAHNRDFENWYKTQTLAEKKTRDDFDNWYKTQTLAEKKTRDTATAANQRQTQFNNHLTRLTNQKLSLMNSLQAKLQAGVDPKTVQPIVDAYNRNVDQMAKAAEAMGAEFDPDEYRISIKPGEKGYFGTSIGGSKPSVAEGGAGGDGSLDAARKALGL